MTGMKGRKYKSAPALYNEFKRPLNLTLTPTGIKNLNAFAQKWKLSLSELVEQIARGIIPLQRLQSRELELVVEPPTNIKPSSIELNSDEGISFGRLPLEVQALH